MLRDALQLIGGWAQESKSITGLKSDGIHGRRLYNVGGKIEEVKLDAPPRMHEVLRLEDLAAWTLDAHQEDHDVAAPETVTWCAFEKVVSVLDDDKLRDSQVTWELGVHPKFREACGLATDLPKMQHRPLVEYVRRTFRDEVGSDFLALLESIKTKSAGESESTAAHGRDSFGKSIAAEVIGAEGIPEEIELELPVWVRFPHKESILFGLHINAMEGLFSFQPVAGAIEDAKTRAISVLTEAVQAACSGRVHAGTP